MTAEQMRAYKADPNDWTAWPVTLWLVAWYRRVDKVEFWASVAIAGWYLIHCVLETA